MTQCINEKKKAYVYDWSLTSDIINMFCIDEKGETHCLKVHEFKPYFYIELPIIENFKWTKRTLGALDDALCALFFQNDAVDWEIKFRKKLYYAHRTSEMEDVYFPYLKYTFSTNENFKIWMYKINANVFYVDGYKIFLKVREANVSPILQFVCQQDIKMTGWIEYEMCDDGRVHFETVKPCIEASVHVPTPMVLSFDIEVYSDNPNLFPSASKYANCIFQISCVFWDAHHTHVYLLTIGDVDDDIVNDEQKVCVQSFTDEAKLIIGFCDLVRLHNPHVITGWNILGFDIKYIIDRAELVLCTSYFASLGMIDGRMCEQVSESWSSSAYGSQNYKYYRWDGRIVIDLMVFAKREIKSENYKLETIASMFVNAHKDPLTHKDIFRAYEYGVIKGGGKKLLSECGKYCVKDSVLVQKLFDTFDMWIGLTESASVCNVPSSYLYTKGQQIKVFSQVYKYCYDNKIVVETDVFKCKANETYSGAFVKEPIPGIYRHIVPFDFKSLYPTIIVAFNIDYSTLVIDSSIPDDMCHIVEWDEDHEYDVHPCDGCGKQTRGDRTAIRNKLITQSFATMVVCEWCGKKFEATFEKIKNYAGTTTSGKKLCPPTYMFKDTYKYRFIKGPKGVLPTIVVNLLQARTDVRKQIKILQHELSTDPTNIRLKNAISVLNKRQLSYKVAANSIYGAMGVREGSLPFMPGAMCVTAIGRLCIHKAGNHLIYRYRLTWLYSDTDSVYVEFPNTPPDQLYAQARQIQKEMIEEKIFPDPMELEFEEVVYDPFFILRKKRYMWRYYNEDGTHSTEVGTKGVILARRGTSKFLKTIYEELVTNIFEGWTKDQSLDRVVEYLNDGCSSKLSVDYFVATAQVGDLESYSKDRAPPAHIHVAEQMRKRGLNVDVGQRIEYVVTTKSPLKSRVMDKAEDTGYQRQFSDVIRIEYLHYVHQTVSQLDELLLVAYKIEDFVKMQYKLRVNKKKMGDELMCYFKPKLTFEETL